MLEVSFTDEGYNRTVNVSTSGFFVCCVDDDICLLYLINYFQIFDYG